MFTAVMLNDDHCYACDDCNDDDDDEVEDDDDGGMYVCMYVCTYVSPSSSSFIIIIIHMYSGDAYDVV